jgi:hypothetical protein
MKNSFRRTLEFSLLREIRMVDADAFENLSFLDWDELGLSISCPHEVCWIKMIPTSSQRTFKKIWHINQPSSPENSINIIVLFSPEIQWVPSSFSQFLEMLFRFKLKNIKYWEGLESLLRGVSQLLTLDSLAFQIRRPFVKISCFPLW